MRWIVGVTVLAPGLAGRPWREDSTKISDAVQDSTGQVWGVTHDVGWGLYRWEDDAWKSVAILGVPGGAGPFALARGSDGAVYCLWSGATGHAITRHQGTSSTLLATFTGHLNLSPRIFVDPNGNVWITEPGRHIFRISREGKVESVYTIADKQFLDFGRLRDEESGFNPVHATADARGRIWFWSDSLARGTNLASLEGVLIFDGEQFEYHPRIAGVPDKKLSILEPDDAAHMWLAVIDEGLYRVDINTLTATPAPQPDAKPFHTVQKIFHANQETYLVSGPVWLPVPERSGNGRSGRLWRQKDGGWKRVVNGLDMRPEYAQSPFRSWLATARGLWVGAFGVGPWFIPAGNAEPVLIDWHHGYPLDGSDHLFQLSDGRLLVIAVNEGNLVVKAADLLAAFQSPPEVQTLNPMRPFIQDVRRHILGILAPGDNALSDWDGKTWTGHPLPGGFDPAHFLTFAEDSLKRVWLLPDARGKSVVIFDPAKETSEIYPSYPEALQAQLPHREGFHLDENFFTLPSFTRDGRICYRDEWHRVRYFDGQKWQLWTRKAIDGGNILTSDGPAFFDQAGNVAVNIQGRTWEFREGAGWHSTSFEPGLGTDRERQAHHFPPVPSGCEIRNPDSVVQDRLGSDWLTFRGQLYRAIPGLCLPQFSPGEHQPFIDSRRPTKVLIDLEGNAFLETYFNSSPNTGEYVVIKARQPLPKTILRATADSSGVVKLHFDTHAKGKTWRSWRVDGGSWITPTHDVETTLDWLSNGKHRIEAAAIDERLQIDPTPAEAVVDIRADTGEQIKALIQKLGDPDYAVREKAVTALVRQPAPALPTLQAAREKAGPDQRWWIDAAIQQIEELLSTNKKP